MPKLLSVVHCTTVLAGLAVASGSFGSSWGQALWGALIESRNPLMGHGLEVEELSEPSFLKQGVGGSVLVRVSPEALPSLVPDSQDGTMEEFKTALRRQIDRCAQQSPTDSWNFGGRIVNRRQWCNETNQKFLELAAASRDFAELYERVRPAFEWYQSIGRDNERQVLTTGYYFPELRGSRTQDGVYKYPLYRKPDDLVQVVIDGRRVWRRKTAQGTYVPFYTREEIDTRGALSGRGLEIVYVDDAFDAFILQVQGSGQVKIREADGSSTSLQIVNYAAQNGQPYVSIGRVLRDRGVDPSYLTLQGLRRYFNEHPDEFWPTLLKNPSYVFFQQAETGPYGAAGTLLTPWHSIAVDTSLFPLGGVALYRTQRPMAFEGDRAFDWRPFSRFAVAQDTGGAIRGAGHIDTYWGSGSYAEIVAGQLNVTGELYFAVVPEAPRRN